MDPPVDREWQQPFQDTFLEVVSPDRSSRSPRSAHLQRPVPGSRASVGRRIAGPSWPLRCARSCGPIGFRNLQPRAHRCARSRSRSASACQRPCRRRRRRHPAGTPQQSRLRRPGPRGGSRCSRCRRHSSCPQRRRRAPRAGGSGRLLLGRRRSRRWIPRAYRPPHRVRSSEYSGSPSRRRRASRRDRWPRRSGGGSGLHRSGRHRIRRRSRPRGTKCRLAGRPISGARRRRRRRSSRRVRWTAQSARRAISRLGPVPRGCRSGTPSGPSLAPRAR